MGELLWVNLMRQDGRYDSCLVPSPPVTDAALAQSLNVKP